MITFKCEHPSSLISDAAIAETVVMSIPAFASLPTVLESFERFLRGCGYGFDGVLDIVPHEESEFGVRAQSAGTTD